MRAVLSKAPGGPDTHHLLDAAKLRLLKPTALLVNTGRGTLIDEAARRFAR